MQIAHPSARRSLKTERLESDLAIIGGGVAGVCAAIAAAREGLSVTLVQDRPVLGGNASSEVRLWVLGATSHMNNNNRWAREGGIIDELLVENWHRNPEGNTILFDMLLLEKVLAEPGIRLLLNTAVYDVTKKDNDTISSVRGFCSQNSTSYELHAPLFCDASGDGIVGFLSGAAFRMGAESQEEFGEGFAPDDSYGQLLGHSMYFYSKDVGQPVRYVPPAFALKDIENKGPRFRRLYTGLQGCKLWWIEYGGRLDTVHDTEIIKHELWKVVYGVWDYIKNSGKFPDAENLTLEWVSTIPGKRESRRFEGDYLLRQQDIIEQTDHPDAVAFGGWSIDLHPADGVFSELPGCSQWHSRGTYSIPYRCLYSRNINNLFLAGRIISATHVAFGSSRVIGTCSHAAQAVGKAAALCKTHGLLPRAIGERHLTDLQTSLLRDGQHIPARPYAHPEDQIASAHLTASSQLELSSLPADGPWLPLEKSRAQMLPVGLGLLPAISLTFRCITPTELTVQVRTGNRPDCHTPDVVLATRQVPLQPGEQTVELKFEVEIDTPRYVFLTLLSNCAVEVRASNERLTGVLSSFHERTQNPPDDIGVEVVEMWPPERRPKGQNFAFHTSAPVHTFNVEALKNGWMRPTWQPNAWLASPTDPKPTLTVEWDQPQMICTVDLFFDSDLDHPVESSLMGHPERCSPFCVKHFRLLDQDGHVLHEETDWHQTLCRINLTEAVTTQKLQLELLATHGGTPIGLFAIHTYECVGQHHSIP